MCLVDGSLRITAFISGRTVGRAQNSMNVFVLGMQKFPGSASAKLVFGTGILRQGKSLPRILESHLEQTKLGCIDSFSVQGNFGHLESQSSQKSSVACVGLPHVGGKIFRTPPYFPIAKIGYILEYAVPILQLKCLTEINLCTVAQHMQFHLILDLWAFCLGIFCNAGMPTF